MRLSDLISEFIISSLGDGSSVDLQRSELAGRFNCVPSQINYVLSTRFTPENGFSVESRRGGGGFIRIRRVVTNPANLIMHAVNSVGDELSFQSAAAILRNLNEYGAVDDRSAGIILAAVSPAALIAAPQDIRHALRAAVFKRCLINCR